MKKLLVVLAMMVAGAAQAQVPVLSPPEAKFEFFQKPNAADIVLQSTFVALTLTDWMQTINFTQNSEWMKTHHEENPFLGRTPSRAKVNTLIPLAILGHTAIAYALPRPYRNIWQGIWIGVEMNAVHSNFKLGVGLSLPWG